MYQLYIQSGPGRGRRVTVRAGDLSIGSGPDCDLRVMMAGLAPSHARVRAVGEGARIEAADGAPLAVNGRAGAAFPLSDGDRISLGALQMQYRSRGGAPARDRRPTGLPVSVAVVLLLAVAAQAAVIGALRTLGVRHVPPPPVPAAPAEGPEAESEAAKPEAGEAGEAGTPEKEAPLWPPSDAARKILF